MAISKVIYGEDTLIDLTADTVTSETLAAGTTAHNSAGEAVIGTVTMLTVEEITQQAAQKVDKESLGLNNVDNTSDMDKPVSTAQQAALAEKAPAGHVANYIECTSSEAVDNAIKAEWSKMADNSIRHIVLALNGGDHGLHSGTWHVTLNQTSYAYGTVTAINYYYNGMTAQRSIFDGTWGEWEWVNPPMVVGEKYRTTERHNGKPVYAKLVDCGQLPNNDVITVQVERYPTAQIEAVVCCDLYTLYQGGIRWQSGGDRITWDVSYEANEFWANVFTTTNFSSYTGRMLVKWTEA